MICLFVFHGYRYYEKKKNPNKRMSAMKNLEDYLTDWTERKIIKAFKLVESEILYGYFELRPFNNKRAACWQRTEGYSNEQPYDPPSSIKILDGEDKTKRGNFCLLYFEPEDPLKTC